MLSLMIIGISLSLYGSHKEDTEAVLFTLKKLIEGSLIEDAHSLEALKDFANVRRTFLDNNRQLILGMPLIAGQTTKEALFDNSVFCSPLHDKLFPMKNEIATTIFPDIKPGNDDEPEDEKDLVAKYTQLCLLGKFPYAILEYVFKKEPIDVDLKACSHIHRKDDQRYSFIGEVLDDEDDSYEEHVGSLETRTKVMQLVTYERSNKISLHLEPENFLEEIEEFLFEEKHLSELKNFMKSRANNLKLKNFKASPAFIKLTDLLSSKNPELYICRNEIVQILDIKLKNDPWVTRSENEKKKLAQEEVVRALILALGEDSDEKVLARAEYLFGNSPVNIDEYTNVEGKNLGEILDSNKTLKNREKIARLTASMRSKYPEKLREALMQWIEKGEDKEVEEKFRDYLITHYGPGDSQDLCFSGGLKCTLDQFFSLFKSKILFPEIGEPKENYVNVDRDFQHLHIVWPMALDNEELLPFVINGQANFNKTYKVPVDMKKIPYKDGMSVGDYLENNRELQASKQYFSLLHKEPEKVGSANNAPAIPLNDQKKIPSEAKSEDDKTKSEVTIAKPMELWKKLTIAGAVGLIGYGFYKYNQKGKHNVVTYVA